MMKANEQKLISKERKQLNQSDEYAAKFRRNPTDITQVQEFLTNAFSIPSQTPDVLKKKNSRERTDPYLRIPWIAWV